MTVRKKYLSLDFDFFGYIVFEFEPSWRKIDFFVAKNELYSMYTITYISNKKKGVLFATFHFTSTRND